MCGCDQPYRLSYAVYPRPHCRNRLETKRKGKLWLRLLMEKRFSQEVKKMSAGERIAREGLNLTLAVVQGNDPASSVYVGNKKKKHVSM